MMNYVEFGQLIKTLRKGSYDQSGHQWTRETLSSAVHLTPDQLGRLERGERKHLETQTLQLLAQCFNLTELEKKEFLCAAVGLSDSEIFNRTEPQTQLENLIAEMENLRLPAFVLDVYADIVAANTAALNLFLLTPEVLDHAGKLPAGYNLINFIYSPMFGCREFFGSLWREIATIEILLFRRSSLRYRHTEYFDHLIKTLFKNKLFDIDWYSSQRYENHYELTYERFNYDHPRFGPIFYIATETIVNTKKGDLYLLLYNPADSVTISVFGDLIKEKGNKLQRLASWPEKKIF